MDQVWKYDIKLEDNFNLEIPNNSQILHIGIQNGIPRMWVRVNPSHPTQLKSFHVRGTGHSIDGDNWRYHGTWQNPPFVFHLFEGV